MNHVSSQMTNREQADKEIYKVFCITESDKDKKNFWHAIGVASRNRDDSITCKLDALPISGVIQLRRHENKPRGGQNNLSAKDSWQKGGY